MLFSIDGTVIRLRYIRGECYVLKGEAPSQPIVEPAVVEMSMVTAFQNVKTLLLPEGMHFYSLLDVTSTILG